MPKNITKKPSKAIQFPEGRTDEETFHNFAETLVSPEMAACRVINGAEQDTAVNEYLDIPALLYVLRQQLEEINSGNSENLEGMLTGQSIALQSLFVRLSERALNSQGSSTFEANMRMALRAQAQCRATIEALAHIRKPPAVYANQANIAQGHQQVNNYAIPETEQNQLSGSEDELQEDKGTPGLACQDDSAMEALGEVDRPKDRGRKT